MSASKPESRLERPVDNRKLARSKAANTHQHNAIIAIYIRKSLEQQELSLPAQERLIRKFITDQGITEAAQVYPDILSGRRPDREGYQQMLADARAGKVKMVIFHKVNRFGRNAAEGLATIEELRRLNVKIRVVDLPALDIYKPEGMFLFTIMLGQGQYEAENLGSEAKKGMIEKLEQGHWTFRAPDGYINQREIAEGRRLRAWIEVDFQRAGIIRLIFRWYRRGIQTLGSIAQRLNRLNEIRISRGKHGCLRRSGKPWDEQSIHKILSNRFYAGELHIPSWDMVRTGKHPLIVRREDFMQVQEILRSQGTLRGQLHEYLLKGMLFLKDGHAIALYATQVRRNDRQYTYYYRYRNDHRLYIEAATVENQVRERMRDRLATLGASPQDSMRQHITIGVTKLKRHAQQRLNRTLEERQRLLHLATKGRFSEVEIEAETQRLAYEENMARTDLARALVIEQSHTTLLNEAADDITAIQAWNSLDTLQLRQVLRRLVALQDSVDAFGCGFEQQQLLNRPDMVGEISGHGG